MIKMLKEKIIRRIAASHLAGPSLPDAVRVYKLAAERGWSSAFGLWTAPDDTPATVAGHCRDALQTILDGSMNCYLSIKLTTLNYDFGLVKELVEKATGGGIRIHFDSMDPDSAAPTMKFIERILATHRNVGYTIAIRWQRSLRDAQQVIDFGIPVRVVKGQWADPASPRINVKRNYLSVIDALAGRAAHVGVATHQRSLAKDALQRLRQAGTSCEMEQMSGLPQNCASLAKALGVPMRLYIGYGYPSLPYSIRQVQARPAIVGWVIRDFILGGRKKLSGAG
jgi:proline dehydrogenase